MTRPRQLTLEALEARSTPAAGTFVEDFTNDTRPGFGGFDSARDGVRVEAYEAMAVLSDFVPTPPGGPAGAHSLRLARGSPADADTYVGWVSYGTRPGQLPPWETVTAAAVSVRGGGSVSFFGDTILRFTNTAPADQWVTFRVTADMRDELGTPIGEIRSVGASAGAQGELLVDDVTFTVAAGPPRPAPVGPGVVRVNRFGNGLGIVGDAGNNYVRVELLDDGAGTVRVSGPGSGTKVIAGAGAVRVDDYTVEVPDFAHVQVFDELGRRTLDERDLFVHLRGGDDQLVVAGADWGPTDPRPATVDDLIVTTGGGDSLVRLEDLTLWDALVVQSGGGNDTLGVFGRTDIAAVRVATGAGNDEVRIGTPGASVFDGEDPGRVRVWGKTTAPPSVVNTGSGSDTVVLAGGWYALIRVNLGSGSDTFRCESVNGLRLTIDPGAGSDLIDFVECAAAIWTLSQSPGDVVRLHRLDFWSFSSPDLALDGVGGIEVLLPASGTELRRADGALVTLTPSTPDLKGLVLGTVFFVEAGGLYDHCSVEFASEDF